MPGRARALTSAARCYRMQWIRHEVIVGEGSSLSSGFLKRSFRRRVLMPDRSESLDVGIPPRSLPVFAALVVGTGTSLLIGLYHTCSALGCARWLEAGAS